MSNDSDLDKLDAKERDLDDRVPHLENWAWTFVIAVRGNMDPEELMAGLAHSVSALNGYPLHRTIGTSVTGSRVLLSVYVSPSRFRNPPSPAGLERAELKCVVVQADLNSRPETVKADEAVARHMLEKVDYAGLAKLLQR